MSTAPVLYENLTTRLSEAQSAQDQARILCVIKNTIAGHYLRKKSFIQRGLLLAIDQVLRDHRIQLGNEYHESQTWYQAASITCAVAHGGPALVQPLLASGLLSSMIIRLSIDASSKNILCILRALNEVADNLPLSKPNAWPVDRRFADLLYSSNNNNKTFASILSSARKDAVSEQACEAVMALIYKTCGSESHKSWLVRTGVLSALCSRLASFVVFEGLVPPSKKQDESDSAHEQSSVFATPTSVRLAPILETICVLAGNSRLNASQLLSDKSLAEVLPFPAEDACSTDLQRTPWGGSYLTGHALSRARPTLPIDQLLPHVPGMDVSGQTNQSSFPPLGTPTRLSKRQSSSSARPNIELVTSPSTGDENSESQEAMLIPLLIFIVRNYHSRARLAAARLLTVLRSHGLVTQCRARSFGILLVPLLVRMLEDRFSDDHRLRLLDGQPYTQAVPLVLSQLIEDQPELQRIAFQAKAIPKLTAALKQSFDQDGDEELRLWQPKKQINQTPSTLAACALGIGGPAMRARHIMVHREGLLRALGAIAPYNDDYRTEICNQGALAQIMLALEPFSSSTIEVGQEELSLTTVGSSTSTLLAACNAVRALTRSVTALRTKIVDAEVGKAIIKLMYNNDPEIRIAATKVIANLAIDFSPLKSSISEPELIRKLCEQAHSANARLRFESIWALKLLALNSSNHVKREIIDELGPNWIKHLIETDPYNIPPGVVIGLFERDYPPRPVSVEQLSGDVIMSEESDEENARDGETANLNDPSIGYNKHTVEDDLGIQEQLFDLLRNLFCGQNAFEIVEYLLEEIGQDAFMRILMDRLRSKTVSGGTRSRSQTTATPTGIIIKALYVLVHIAVCGPRFRTMISSNPGLLRLIIGFCTHSEAELRTQCCWLVTALTYDDTSTDREDCRHRALQLHKIGFLSHMRRLENDPDLNVRERAKTALHLLEKFL